MNGQTDVVVGPELYSEMQRLICDWYGMDAAERMDALPKLVRDLVRLQQSYANGVAHAAHDGSAEVNQAAEAA